METEPILRMSRRRLTMDAKICPVMTRELSGSYQNKTTGALEVDTVLGSVRCLKSKCALWHSCPANETWKNEICQTCGYSLTGSCRKTGAIGKKDSSVSGFEAYYIDAPACPDWRGR